MYGPLVVAGVSITDTDFLSRSADARESVAIPKRHLDILTRAGPYPVGATLGPPQTDGNTVGDVTRRDHPLRRYQRTRGDHGLSVHLRTVEHDRPRTDQASIIYPAPLEVRQMPYQTVVSDLGRQFCGGVQHCAILDCGTFTDRDVPEVAPKHRTGPHRAVRAQSDRADHRRRGVHVGGRVDRRDASVDRPDGQRDLTVTPCGSRTSADQGTLR